MKINMFISSESGAVAVDWVVLTAGIVGLGLATAAVVAGGVEDLSGELQASLVNIDVTVSPFGAVMAAATAAIPGLLYMSESDFNEVIASLAGASTQELLERLAWYHADVSGRAAGNEGHNALRQHVDMTQAIAFEMNRRGEPTPEQATDIRNQYTSYYE